MAEIASLEDDIRSYRTQLEDIESLLALDPSNDEYIALKQDITDAIQLTEDALNELRPKPKAAPAPRESSPSEPAKWSKENHPAFQPGYKKPGDKADASSAPAVFKVGDQVLAKWVSGDGGFYPARITSLTGSSANPIYYVEFKKYKNTETVKYADLKHVQSHGGGDSRKRKADGSLASAPTPPSASSTPPIGNTVVPPPPPKIISAAASLNPDFVATEAEQKTEPSLVGDGPARPQKIPKKIKNKKEYEAGKNNWQAFNVKGSGSKMAKAMGKKKESMFRTGDSVNSRGELFESCCDV
jgi:survival-of-motor-neuron-related-splicing factor 30